MRVRVRVCAYWLILSFWILFYPFDFVDYVKSWDGINDDDNGDDDDEDEKAKLSTVHSNQESIRCSSVFIYLACYLAKTSWWQKYSAIFMLHVFFFVLSISKYDFYLPATDFFFSNYLLRRLRLFYFAVCSMEFFNYKNDFLENEWFLNRKKNWVR